MVYFLNSVQHGPCTMEPQNPKLPGSYKREDFCDRLTPKGCGKCMSKPKLIVVFQKCPVVFQYFESRGSCKCVNHYSYNFNRTSRNHKFHSLPKTMFREVVFCCDFFWRTFSIATCVLGGLGLRLGL